MLKEFDKIILLGIQKEFLCWFVLTWGWNSRLSCLNEWSKLFFTQNFWKVSYTLFEGKAILEVCNLTVRTFQHACSLHNQTAPWYFQRSCKFICYNGNSMGNVHSKQSEKESCLSASPCRSKDWAGVFSCVIVTNGLLSKHCLRQNKTKQLKLVYLHKTLIRPTQEYSSCMPGQASIFCNKHHKAVVQQHWSNSFFTTLGLQFLLISHSCCFAGVYKIGWNPSMP